MVTTALVEQDIRDGERLIRALDERGVPITAAFWLLDPDTREWRLILSSPLVDEKGPFDLYLTVNEILASVTTARMRSDDVQVVETTFPLLTELQIFHGTDEAPFIGGMLIQRETVGDTYVEGCYLYRAVRIVGIDHDFQLRLAYRQPGRVTWAVAPGTAIVKHGFLVELQTPADVVRTTAGERGLNAEYYTIKRVVTQNGKAIGQLTKWVWRNGRLRAMEDVARPVALAAGSKDGEVTVGAPR
jgi:hypothetical protein